MRKFIYLLFLVMMLSCKVQMKNDNDYQSMRNVINQNIKNTLYYNVKKKYNIQPKFYITNLSNVKKKTIKSDYLKNGHLLKDGVYAFYIKDIRYSYTHIYIKLKGKIKIFESVNCPTDNLKINQVITYIKNNFDDNESLIKNISNYSKYIQYFRIDPQSRLKCP